MKDEDPEPTEDTPDRAITSLEQAKRGERAEWPENVAPDDEAEYQRDRQLSGKRAADKLRARRKAKR